MRVRIFKNRFGELRSGWAIAAILLLIIVAQGVGRSLVPENDAGDNVFLILGVSLVYGTIAIGGGLLLFKLLYRRNRRQLGLIPEGRAFDLLRGVGIGAVSMGLVFGILLFSGQAKTTLHVSKLLNPVILINLASVSLTAFSEEFLVRGLMMTALKTTRSKWAILCTSSVLFSLVHLLNPWATALSLMNTFLAGLLFAYMFIKSGKLWLPTGYHIAWNFLQGDVFGMNVSGQAQWSAFGTSMGANVLLTGGNAGPEGGLVVTGILLLGALYVRYAIAPPKQPHWTIDGDLPLVSSFSFKKPPM